MPGALFWLRLADLLLGFGWVQLFFVSGFLRSKAHLLPQIQIVRAEAVPERKSGLGVW